MENMCVLSLLGPRNSPHTARRRPAMWGWHLASQESVLERVSSSASQLWRLWCEHVGSGAEKATVAGTRPPLPDVQESEEGALERSSSVSVGVPSASFRWLILLLSVMDLSHCPSCCNEIRDLTASAPSVSCREKQVRKDACHSKNSGKKKNKMRSIGLVVFLFLPL